MWYVLSCWIFVKGSIGQIQRMIRNFLCSAGDGRCATVKVAWSTLTLTIRKQANYRAFMNKIIDQSKKTLVEKRVENSFGRKNIG